MAMTDRQFHVVRGETAAWLLNECLQIDRRDILVAEDDLACGPLTAITDQNRWRELRGCFWQAQPGEPGVASLDLYGQLEAAKGDLAAARSIDLWLGPVLSERILLGWLVTAFELLGLDSSRLRQVDLSEQKYRDGALPSIGMLNCEAIGSLGSSHRLRDEDRGSHGALWAAVSSPTSDALLAFRKPEAPHAPELKRAAGAFLAHYPAVETGLNYWDRLLLENCAAKPRKSARIVAEAMGHDAPYPDWPSDTYLFGRLVHLGDPHLAHPLVEIRGDPWRQGGESPMRTTEVAITETGVKVLNGEANFVALNGIDERVGGVHLSSRAGKVWFFDGETLVPG